jgi:hypothetical protein
LSPAPPEAGWETPRRPARATDGDSRRRVGNDGYSVEYRKGVRRAIIVHPKFGKLVSDQIVPPDHEIIWIPAKFHHRLRKWKVENAFSPSAWCNSRAAPFVRCFFMCEPALASQLLDTFRLPDNAVAGRGF